jgi:hypothetical protein
MLDLGGSTGPFNARLHGQTIYADPTAEMLLVRSASYPQPKIALIDPTLLPAYQAVADYLMTKWADSAKAPEPR